MVLYNSHKKGSQCGGTSSKKSGDTDKCLDITGKRCVDLSVNANVGIADCTFNFRTEKDCKGDLSKSVTVQGGRDSNGVDLRDDVKFVSVSCGLGGRKTVSMVVEIVA